jgi:uncharacterized protein
LDKLDKLRGILLAQAPLIIAYSGGVDSTFLLAFATEELPAGSVTGVIADSPSLPRAALARAIEVAHNFGAALEVLQTAEVENPEYAKNSADRCYFCKATLFGDMEALAAARNVKTLAYGENADDAMVIRPGARAAEKFHVTAPLRDAGLTKSEIRQASRDRNLPTAEDPAQPCLSSRVAHGIPVTRETLGLVERAEEAVRELGFAEFRVRHRVHDGVPYALLCVAGSESALLQTIRNEVLAAIRGVGYRYAVIDPGGYRPPERLPRAKVNEALDKIVVSHY